MNSIMKQFYILYLTIILKETKTFKSISTKRLHIFIILTNEMINASRLLSSGKKLIFKNTYFLVISAFCRGGGGRYHMCNLGL